MKRNAQIAELEMKSRLFESEFRMSHVEQTLQQNAACNDILHMLGSNNNPTSTPSTFQRSCSRSPSASTNSPSEDASRPPRSGAARFGNSLKVSKRPYFASVTGLNMVNSPQVSYPSTEFAMFFLQFLPSLSCRYQNRVGSLSGWSISFRQVINACTVSVFKSWWWFSLLYQERLNRLRLLSPERMRTEGIKFIFQITLSLEYFFQTVTLIQILS